MAFRQPDDSLITAVYRKPTYTDLYLLWDSHDNLAAKFSAINTLTHRAETVCSNPQWLKDEEDHLKQALQQCKDALWALNRDNIKCNRSNKSSNNIMNNSTSNGNKAHIVVLYIKGVSESWKNISNIQMYFKGGRTIKDLIGNSKDRDPILQKNWVIYRYKCGRVDCEEE